MHDKTTLDLGIAPPERRFALRLSDGRILAGSEWGPPHGQPVLFCTGAGMSGSLGFGSHVLEDLGLRLLAPDRPGLGGSDEHLDKTLMSWVQDIQEVIAALDLRSVAAVGFSQGAPFALALAASRMVHAAVIVSGQDDLGHPELTPLLPPEVATMLAAARHDPQGFERRMAEMATGEGLWELVVGMSGEHDRALYASEPFAEAYRKVLREGFSQGAAGYARDLLNTLGPWPFAPEAIDVPVSLWYGGLDSSPVHSPDLGVTLAGRLPRASLTIDPHAGSSILWTRAHDILSQLRCHMSETS